MFSHCRCVHSSPSRICSNVIPAMRFSVTTFWTFLFTLLLYFMEMIIHTCWVSFLSFLTLNIQLSVPWVQGLGSVSHPQCLKEINEKATSRHFWGECINESINQWGGQLSSNCLYLHGIIGGGASLVAQMVKILPAMQETWVQSLGWEDSLEKGGWLPTPGFLPGKSHGQRSLATVHGVAKSWTRLSD